MTPNISLTVRMTFLAQDREAIAAALLALTAASRQEPGCVSYVPHSVQEDPDTIVIYEQYIDEQALDAHKRSPHFHLYAEGVLYKKMLSRDVEMLEAVC